MTGPAPEKSPQPEVKKVSKPSHSLMFKELLPTKRLQSLLEEENSFDDLAADIEIECAQLSDDKVLAIWIPRPRLGAFDGAPGVGSAFVRFETVAGATQCKKLMSGRQYAGEPVDCDYFSDAKFEAADFSELLPNYDSGPARPPGTPLN